MKKSSAASEARTQTTGYSQGTSGNSRRSIHTVASSAVWVAGS